MNLMTLPPVLAGSSRTAFNCPESAAAAGDGPDEDLMTRRQVATLFGVTSASVATWARRGRLPEVRNEDGKPRYRRADVEALVLSSSVRRRTR